jgi:SAM-dependent methyltransferase
MRTAKSVVPRSHAAGVLIGAFVVVIETFGAPAAWSQEPVQPRLKEEFLKQEQIYQSRGNDGRRTYTTGRGLSKYADLLFSDFCDALSRLGSSERWLDVGAGEGQAILDYYGPDIAAPAERCRGSGPPARAVAISIEDRRTDNWKRQAAGAGDGLRYLYGKRLGQYLPEELGKFQLITDVYGGFTYTDDLARFTDRVL